MFLQKYFLQMRQANLKKYKIVKSKLRPEIDAFLTNCVGFNQNLFSVILKTNIKRGQEV